MRPPSRRRSRVRFWGVGLVLALGITGLALGVKSSKAPWDDGETRGRFRSVYNGYGSVTGNDQHMVLMPASATDADTTHAALVVTRDDYDRADFEVTLTTEKQLRTGQPPNPWEVAWALWNYTDDEHFYAVALKPNGWEISKQDPAYPGHQRYLATGTEPTFPIGTSYTVWVRQTGDEMVVGIPGRTLAVIVDDERPYHTGAIGFYTEDADVRFENLRILDE